MKLKIIAIVFFIIMMGCKNKETSDTLRVGKILRLDKEIFALDKVNPDVRKIREQYGGFFDIYVGGILDLGNISDSNFISLFSLFLRDSIVNEVYDSVELRYSDLSVLENDLSKAFGYYHAYFPDKTIPQVYTYISGFNQSIMVDSASVGISLDNYLGENCTFYQMLAVPIPWFVRRKMTEDNIVKDVLFGWLNTEFPYRPKQNDLISGMIYQGKIIYLLRKILPDYGEERLFDYSKEQLEWCRNNEKQIWNFLLENECLFSTQQMLLRKYLEDAPFSSGMPNESPGKAVVWCGAEIVEKYVRRTNVNLSELMAEQDFHRILRVSGYRP